MGRRVLQSGTAGPDLEHISPIWNSHRAWCSHLALTWAMPCLSLFLVDSLSWLSALSWEWGLLSTKQLCKQIAGRNSTHHYSEDQNLLQIPPFPTILPHTTIPCSSLPLPTILPHTDGARGLLFCAAKRSGAFPSDMPAGLRARVSSLGGFTRLLS